MFAIGAVVLWRSQSAADGADDPAEAVAEDAKRLSFRRIAVTVFGIVFVAEWGDLAQLATASLASTRRRCLCSSARRWR